MFEHWLEKYDLEIHSTDTQKKQLLAHDFSTNPQISSSTKKPAILGLGRKWANLVRGYLYNSASLVPPFALVDLGNFRKTNEEFVVPALRELIASNYLPILIASRSTTTCRILRQINTSQQNTVRTVEDIPEGLNRNTTLLGVQQQLCAPATLDVLASQGVNYHRIGRMRDQMENIEPILRDAKYLHFDFNALRSSDFPAQRSRSTSGFFTEEACRLTRYAGAAPHLSCAMFAGIDALSPYKHYSANTAAQLLWYFLYGMVHRIQENPAKQQKHFQQYHVQLTDYALELVFHKSNRSGRWWLSIDQNGKSTSVYSACRHQDYLLACENVISDFVLQKVADSLQTIQ